MSNAFFECLIELNKSEPGFCIHLEGLAFQWERGDGKRKALTAALQKSLAKLPKVEGKRKFTVDSIHALRKAVEVGYP